LTIRFDSTLGRILTGLLNLLILNILFLLTSIPVFTIGAGLSALFSTCRKMQEDMGIAVIRTYFRDFGACFRKATAAWLGIGLSAAALIFSFSYYYAQEGSLRYVFMALAGILLLLDALEFLYVFPLIGWYDNSLTEHLKNAPQLAVLHFPTTLLLTALYAAAFAVVIRVLPITFCIACSTVVYYADLLLRKVFVSHDPAAAESPSEQPADQLRGS